jgi:DNA-binding MarR family transcriptional regulator
MPRHNTGPVRTAAGLPVSYLIATISRAISRELATVRRPGIAGPQVAPLLALRREPGLSNAQLARRSYVTPQSMNDVVIGLEQEGLIRRTPDDDNRRILRAHLTPAGRKFLSSWEKAIDRMEDRLFEGFTGEDLRTLTIDLERCAENMGLGPGHHSDHGPSEPGDHGPVRARRSRAVRARRKGASA